MVETAVVSHWYNLIDGLAQSPQTFYASLEESVKRRAVPDIRLDRVELAEGGLLSGKREYVRVKRKDYTFDLCAAPFGSGFFVSWWLWRKQGFFESLAEIPVLGVLFRPFTSPMTYYRYDTALMFQSAVHSAVLEVLDESTAAKGTRKLSDADRRPVLHEFFRR